MTRRLFRFLIIALALGCWASIYAGCATTSGVTMETRLAAMSDEDLLSYYHGINDRLKEIQTGTREADRQGTILQEDQLSKMPYIIGGEAWELEQKSKRARRELARRHLKP
jgi:hypothetical protein